MHMIVRDKNLECITVSFTRKERKTEHYIHECAIQRKYDRIDIIQNNREGAILASPAHLGITISPV